MNAEPNKIVIPRLKPTPRFGVRPTKREEPRKGQIPRRKKHRKDERDE